jgi:hypothetical protein
MAPYGYRISCELKRQWRHGSTHRKNMPNEKMRQDKPTIFGGPMREKNARKNFIGVYSFFRERFKNRSRCNLLILFREVVGAPGLEPGTR